MKYYIIAGEASGDLHGSNLMKGIYAEDPQADIRFWGGDCMASVWNVFQNNPSHSAAAHCKSPQDSLLTPHDPCGQGDSTVLKNISDLADSLSRLRRQIDEGTSPAPKFDVTL